MTIHFFDSASNLICVWRNQLCVPGIEDTVVLNGEAYRVRCRKFLEDWIYVYVE
jgi:hypothetical protein